VSLREGVARVSPDPFEGAAIPIAVRARVIPARRYASDEALHRALDAAEETTLEGLCRGAAFNGTSSRR
jgi:hypothetical protein